MALRADLARWQRMPKVDLHVHLDGSVRPSTVLDLAQRRGVRLPAKDERDLERYMKVQGECASLTEYLRTFEFVGTFLHSAEALERVAFELVEQAHGSNCKYIEVRFGPQLHRREGLTTEEVMHHVLEGLKRGERTYGVKARGIACCMRNHGIADNIEVVESAARFIGQGLVAVDLAGPEAAFPAQLHEQVFALAGKKDIPVTIHAGEAAGPDNIYDAVTKLGAARIGHGIRLREDGETLRLIKRSGIPLEMCPISNIQTKASRDWNDYPIREYIEHGIKVTVNTDNLTVSDTNLSKEYAALAEHFGFTEQEIGRLVLNGADAAFLPETEKRELRKLIETEIKQSGLATQ